MTTEELARRFCELAGLEILDPPLDGAVYVFEGKKGDVIRHPLRFDGWPGVGIVVDEMALRGFRYAVMSQDDLSGHFAQFWYDYAAGRKRAMYEGHGEPLDAVLAAAIAALEAEAKP